MDITVAPSGYFRTLERRYHLLHVLAVAFVAAGIIAALVLMFAPRPAWGPDLSLSGSVPQSLVLTVTPTADATALTLAENTVRTALSVADVFEKSNRANGYTITVTSANLGLNRCPVTTKPCLWNVDADAEDILPFDLIKFGAGTVNLTAGTGNWTNRTTKNKAGTTAAAQVAYDTGTVLRTEGAYVETLTFTIAPQ